MSNYMFSSGDADALRACGVGQRFYAIDIDAPPRGAIKWRANQYDCLIGCNRQQRKRFCREASRPFEAQRYLSAANPIYWKRIRRELRMKGSRHVGYSSTYWPGDVR